MKIALLGYGKMGKEVEKIALERGHEIILKKTAEPPSFSGLEQADVAVDFSVPSAAVENISTCLKKNIPIISGTTGWLEHLDQMKELTHKSNGSFLYASNFSVGVNIFFELNKYLARIMAPQKQYTIAMEEIHHTQKLDAPSGTAITLAQDIIAQTDYTNWTLDEGTTSTIPIVAKRIPDVPGTHSITYQSDIDTIEITHTAHSRKGFALGAVLAAEWIRDKKGVFSMKDVLNLG